MQCSWRSNGPTNIFYQSSPPGEKVLPKKTVKKQLVKDSAPWLELVHCFNHRVELALKDAFEKTFFKNREHVNEALLPLSKKSKMLPRAKRIK